MKEWVYGKGHDGKWVSGACISTDFTEAAKEATTLCGKRLNEHLERLSFSMNAPCINCLYAAMESVVKENVSIKSAGEENEQD